MHMLLSTFESEMWTPQYIELWERIERHNFEPVQRLNFLGRLARDQNWTLIEARAAVEAYRRFCFLATVSSSPMTPSEAVDEVWHQHLIYSCDYWDIWCGQVLRKVLHHDPTPGGAEAQIRYRWQYAQTLALHEQFFGPPPAKLWPATHVRFGAGRRNKITDLMSFVVVPRRVIALRNLFLK